MNNIITSDFVGINQAYDRMKKHFEEHGGHQLSFKIFLEGIQIPIIELIPVEIIEDTKEENGN